MQAQCGPAPPDPARVKVARLIFRILLIAVAVVVGRAIAKLTAAPGYLQFIRSHPLASVYCFVLIEINVVLHELGHALAALAAGLRIESIRIGCFMVHRDHAGPFRFAWSRRYFSGAVCYTWPDDLSLPQLRQAFFSIAGPLANFGSVIPAYYLFAWAGSQEPIHSFWVGIAWLLMLTGAFMAFISVFPIRETGICSDGDRFLAHLLTSRLDLAVQRLKRGLNETRRLTNPESAALLATLAAQCESISESERPHPEILHVWAETILEQAWRAADPKGFDSARDKFTAALALNPGSAPTLCGIGHTFSLRPKPGDPANLFTAASWYDRALAINPRLIPAVTHRAAVLSKLANVAASEHLLHRIEVAQRHCAGFANPSEANQKDLCAAQGTLLMARSACIEGEHKRMSLLDARKVLETIPETAAYDLACIAAQLGEPGVCRQWLEQSGEPGKRVTTEHMVTDPDLAPVRNEEWFTRRLHQDVGCINRER